MAVHQEEIYGFLARDEKVLPIIGLEGEKVVLKGEYRAFQTDLFKARRSGYALRDCVDGNVLTLWRKAEQQLANAMESMASEHDSVKHEEPHYV